WGKLALAAFYFATALVDADVLETLARPELRPMMGRLVREVVAVARAMGVRCEPIDGFDVNAFADRPEHDSAVTTSWRALENYWRTHLTTRTGIWRDLAVHHRKTEADDEIGAVVSRGRSAGVSTPLLNSLLDLIHDVEN